MSLIDDDYLRDATDWCQKHVLMIDANNLCDLDANAMWLVSDDYMCDVIGWWW